MTVEEQLLLNTMTAECARLHKAIENIKRDIKLLEVIEKVDGQIAICNWNGMREKVLKIIDKHTEG